MATRRLVTPQARAAICGWTAAQATGTSTARWAPARRPPPAARALARGVVPQRAFARRSRAASAGIGAARARSSASLDGIAATSTSAAATVLETGALTAAHVAAPLRVSRQQRRRVAPLDVGMTRSDGERGGPRGAAVAMAAEGVPEGWAEAAASNSDAHTASSLIVDATSAVVERTRQRIRQWIAAADARVTAGTVPGAAVDGDVRRGLYVTLSYAQSLDGSIAAHAGAPLRLSNDATMQMTHALRAAHDMILVGVGTVIADDPQLNVRLTEGASPLPVVLDSTLRTPLDCRLLSSPECRKPVVLTTEWDPKSDPLKEVRARALRDAGATVLPCCPNQVGTVSVHDAMATLRDAGLGHSIMIEGGATVLRNFLYPSMPAVRPVGHAAAGAGTAEGGDIAAAAAGSPSHVGPAVVSQVVVTVAPVVVGGVQPFSRFAAGVASDGSAAASEGGPGAPIRVAGLGFPRISHMLACRADDDIVICGDVAEAGTPRVAGVTEAARLAAGAIDGAASRDSASTDADGTIALAAAFARATAATTHTEFVTETPLPTDEGVFRVRMYRCFGDATTSALDPIAVIAGDISGDEPVPVRVHDQCFTSEVLGSIKCDCAQQLQLAKRYIHDMDRGVIVYLHQEGRGIGLANKLRAYALQENEGLDTVDANRHLGLPDDARVYGPVRAVLDDLGVKRVQLLTNNPRKVAALTALGVDVVERVPVVAASNGASSTAYLEVKGRRMGHLLDASSSSSSE